MPSFAHHLQHLTWYPTEQLSYLADLAARVQLAGHPNLRPPTLLDVRQSVWPVRSVDAIFTANTLHIMSWPEVIAMYRGIGSVLAPGGVLCVYGPFRYEGRYTSESNREFDRSLQARHPPRACATCTTSLLWRPWMGCGSRPITTCRRSTGSWSRQGAGLSAARRASRARQSLVVAVNGPGRAAGKPCGPPPLCRPPGWRLKAKAAAGGSNWPPAA